MPLLLSERTFYRESLVAGEDIDISVYSRGGRLGANARAFLCTANQIPQFLYMESADEGNRVTVAWLGKGRVEVKYSGISDIGDKVSMGANAVCRTSNTNEAGPLLATDFAVVQTSSGSDGDEIIISIVRDSV